jgi:hypothetical protein
MREKLGEGVRHEEISIRWMKGEIILQRRDFKENNFIGRAESFLSPLTELTWFSDPHPALVRQRRTQTGLKL